MNENNKTMAAASGLTKAEERKYNSWKHGLLDIGKRNRMINFRRTTRSTLRITDPSMSDLYRRIAVNEESISFKRRVDTSSDKRLTGLFYIMDKVSAPVELTTGEIGSDRPAQEMDLTLKNLRSRARLSLEEQGINILYLCLGFLEWKQKATEPFIRSPLVMVPVAIERSSITSPYMLSKTEEDIVVNPTLEYVLSSEYGIEIPAFDPADDGIGAYLDSVEKAVSALGWRVAKETYIGLLSFLKIVMYKDLEKYRDRIFANPVIQALCGNVSALPPIRDEWRNFDHDSVPCSKTCEVVNADASQQDAISLSKNGVSFVLQGPPGTGKSQTITNIIAQALADGRKVLFVSEKMAALSVVYRRLQEVGLADYCLSLHNYKAEKKGVIADLVNTLDAPVRELRPGVSDFLDDLEEERAELNRYFAEMNRLREPLNMTIYEAVSELARMEKVPYYSVTEPVRGVTNREYRDRLGALRKLEALIRLGGGCGSDHPWRNSTIRAVTLETRRDVERTLSELEAKVFGAAAIMSLAVPDPDGMRTFRWKDYGELRTGIKKSLFLDGILRKAAAHYNTGEDLHSVFSFKISDADTTLSNLLSASSRCCSFGVSFGEIETRERMDEFRTRMNRSAQNAQRAHDLIGELTECVDGAADTLQLTDKTYTFGNIVMLGEKLRILSDSEVFPQSWSERYTAEEVKSFATEFKELAEQAEDWKRNIEEEWDRTAYERINEEQMLRRFQENYRSIFKWFNSSYKQDVAELTRANRNSGGRSLTDSECVKALENLREYKAFSKKFSAEEIKAREILGMYYAGTNTDWERLGWAIDDLRKLEAFEKEHGACDRLRQLLVQDRADRCGVMLGSRTVAEWRKSGKFKEFSELEEIRGTDPSSDRTTGQNLREVRGDLEGEIRRMKEAELAVSDLTAVMTGAAASIRESGLKYTEEAVSSLTSMTAFFKRYVDTACKVREGIGLKKTLKKHFDIDTLEAGDRDIPEIFGEHVDRDVIREDTDSVWQHFETVDGGFGKAFDDVWNRFGEPDEDDKLFGHFSSWFTEGEVQGLSLTELSDRIAGCRDLNELSRWTSYSDVRSRCLAVGLEDYINEIEKKESSDEAPQQSIVETYKKGFLTKWIIETITEENITGLLRFQPVLQEQLIKEFEENDTKNLRLSRAKLTGKLSAEKPAGVNHLANAMDEVTILRKESEKRRRVMPLRKLFKVIPTLMQRLKPCFMMSPLSVSYFLDSDLYKFDMVIFDEASQIFPEDAVGAIYRGNQTIIAGDTRQMPPTNFFNSTSMKEEYDTEEDDDEIYVSEDCESILDEAGACLPSCTLLWHYRSKDESLIAFSNREIYNNRLITFPNCGKSRDKGLEYVYVPDGCYSDRTNIREALKCVALIGEHIKTHPERSLGVIAFSEKQQAVIEDAVSDFRLQNPQYESFFDENREEPFFVKNLENVQGDERDTILFSVCYAKNSRGRMYMRFGPLGAAGGERRLNVAITRAKYNVKLIGSVLPTDIDLNRTQSEGVRLLRSYIYYAMQNDYAVPWGADAESTAESFADTVAVFLTQNGYRVRRSVGESDYKIDIAVVHPDRENEYMAGIECDGANYTMARTARDRDILRKRIMTAAGWQLHHVWSFNWFKDMKGEKERLLRFLIDAKRIRDGQNTETEETPPVNFVYTDPAITAGDMTVEKETPDDSAKLVFKKYTVCDPMSAHYVRGQGTRGNLAHRIMYVMEKEAPIHRDVLYKRIAPVFGNRKVTVLVKRSVDQCVSQTLADSVLVRDDFMYLKDQGPVKARVPGEGQEPRAIEHICSEEICDAVLEILRSSYSLTPEDLTAETARTFGFVRTGPRIRLYLETNYDKLLNAGKIVEADGKYFIKED